MPYNYELDEDQSAAQRGEAQKIEGKILLLFNELPIANRRSILQHLKDELEGVDDA